MKAITISSLLICFIFFSVSAKAQRYDTKVFSGGFGIEGGLPSGMAESAMTGSFGLNVRFGFRAGPGFITLTGGITGFLGVSNDKGKYDNGDYGGAVIPVKVGYKYFFQKHLFVMADGGGHKYFMSHGDGAGHAKDVNGFGFTVSPSVGAQFGVFEIALKYEIFTVNNGNISNACVRLGLDF